MMNIKQARAVKIESFLQSKPSRVVADEAWYLSPFRDEKTPSFKVNRTKNIWYDFGEGHGGDSISFIRTLHKLPDVSAALAKMDELVSNSPSSHPQAPPPSAANSNKAKAPPVKVTDIGPIRHPALTRYLSRRAIDPKLAADYLNEIHYSRGDKSYFALALTNDTGLQTGLGFEVRNEHFKGSLGPKDIRTIPGDTNSVTVYEGVFDYLSHLSLTSDGQLDATAIVLNSAAMKERAATKIRRLCPAEVNLYLDNDDAGKQLAGFFREALPGIQVNDKSGLYSGWKDLNEFHAAKSPMARLTRNGLLKEMNRQLERESPSL